MRVKFFSLTLQICRIWKFLIFMAAFHYIWLCIIQILAKFASKRKPYPPIFFWVKNRQTYLAPLCHTLGISVILWTYAFLVILNNLMPFFSHYHLAISIIFVNRGRFSHLLILKHLSPYRNPAIPCHFSRVTQGISAIYVSKHNQAISAICRNHKPFTSAILLWPHNPITP